MKIQQKELADLMIIKYGYMENFIEVNTALLLFLTILITASTERTIKPVAPTKLTF